MNKKRYFALILGLFLMLSCKPQGRTSAALTAGGAGGSNSVGNEQIFGGWAANRLPITVKLSGDFTGTEQSRLVTASNKWETAAGRNLFNFGSNSIPNKDYNSLNSYLDGSIEVHQVNTGAFNNGALAVAVFHGVYINQGTSSEYIRINDSDILFNYKDYVFNTDPAFGEFDLESVMVHEVGHLLGMAHISFGTASSVMNPSISSGTKIRGLFNIDRTNIRKNYPSSALSSALSFSTTGSTAKPKEVIGEEVSGYYELSADRTCTHVINGEVVHIHKAESID
jgi:hypothetical protein